MTKDEALKLALEALEATLGTLIAANEKGIITDTIWFSKYETLFDYISSEIAVFNEALAQHDSVQAKPEPEQKPVEVKFPRHEKQSEDNWTIDPAFIARVKQSIDPETPWDFIPEMEQVETTLLALEVIPSNLYTTPPQTVVNQSLTTERYNSNLMDWHRDAPLQKSALTEEQIEKEWQFLHDEEGNPPDHHDFAQAIEAAHGIKQTL